MRKTALSLALLALCACTPRSQDQTADDSAAQPADATTASASAHAFVGEINAADFAEHVQQLASDDFGGRGPGTAGVDKTVEYIKAQFARIGLQPGNGSD